MVLIENICAIYMIKNIINEKIYIGSTIDIEKRWYIHKNQLEQNKHHNKHLQRSWNKYGENNFKFEIIEYIEDKTILLKREQYWMEKLRVYDIKFGYNILPTAGSTLGFKHSEDSKKLFSKIQKEIQNRKEIKLKRSIFSKNNYKNSKLYKLNSNATGENNPNSKLTKNEVIKIKELLSQGYLQIDIAKNFNTSKANIQNIKSGKAWGNITIPEFRENKNRRDTNGEYNPMSKLTNEEVKTIKIMIKNGMSNVEISKIFNVTHQTISLIKLGKTYRNVS